MLTVKNATNNFINALSGSACVLFRKRALLASAVLLMAVGFSGAVAPQTAYAATGTFKVSDYGTTTPAHTAMSQYWRGYVFQVPVDTTITKLVGGGQPNFQVAIYAVASLSMDGNTVTPGAALGHASNVSGALNEELTIAGGNAGAGTQIALAANTNYLLASGQAGATNSPSNTNYHWTMPGINIANLLSLSPVISSWKPSTGVTYYWSSPASNSQVYSWLVGKANNALSGDTMPALGFQYEISDAIDPPTVATVAPLFNGSTGTLRGRIDATGGDDTAEAIIWGKTAGLTDGHIESIGTIEADAETPASFFFSLTPPSSGNYYYRARGDNAGGITLGSIVGPYAAYSLTYAAGMHGSLTGTTSQVVWSSEHGTAVTAVPADGYHFDKWSDDSTQNPRTDTDASGNINVTAQFVEGIAELGIYGHVSDGSDPIEGAIITLGCYKNDDTPVPPPVAIATSDADGYYQADDGLATMIAAVTDAGCENGDLLIFTASANGYESGGGGYGIGFVGMTAGEWAEEFYAGGGEERNFALDLIEAPTFMLSFNPQGGSSLSSIGNVEENDSIELPAAPTRSGYTFKNWNTQPNGGGTSYVAGASYSMPPADTTLFAIWQAAQAPKKATTTGGSSSSSSTTSFAQTTTPGSSASAPASSAPSAPSFAGDLKTGSTGDDVSNLQRFLNAHGFPLAPSGPGSPNNETDMFGKLTREALAKFQAANGIVPANGEFDPTTRAAVEALLAKGNPDSPESPTAPIPGMRDLTVGDRGEDVRMLQTLLIAQGYSIPAGATAFFGDQTQSALAKYQSEHNISPSAGYFGEKTRAQMKTAGMSGLWW